MTDLQKELLKLLKEIDELCRNNGIEYYLAAGTALGAVRHHGFLPWDDDADIHMTRENWEKFIRLKDTLPDDRAIVAMEDDFHCGFTVGRYADISTTRLYRYLCVNPQPAGVIVDILVLDPLPDDPAEVEAYTKDLVSFAVCMVDATQHTHRTPYDIDADALYKREKEIGRDALLKELWEKTMSHTDPSGTLLIQRDPMVPHVWPAKVFGRAKYIPFEDTELPVGEQAYLQLTGTFDEDWMYVPERMDWPEHMKTVILGISNNNAYDDYRNTVDFESMREDCIRANRFNNRIGAANKEQVRLRLELTAAKVRLSYRKKEWDGEALLQSLKDRKHDELDAFFEEYRQIQCSKSFIGGTAIDGWERKEKPIYIDIDDDFLYVFLRNLMHRGILGKSRVILAAREAKGELSPRLAELRELIDRIKECSALLEHTRFEQVRDKLKADRAAYPENRPLMHLWFGNEYYLCRSEEDYNALLKEINTLPREDMMDDVVQTVRAYVLWKLGLTDRSAAVLRTVAAESHHGLVLLSIRRLISRFTGSVIAQETEQIAAYRMGEAVALPKSLQQNADAGHEGKGETK